MTGGQNWSCSGAINIRRLLLIWVPQNMGHDFDKLPSRLCRGFSTDLTLYPASTLNSMFHLFSLPFPLCVYIYISKDIYIYIYIHLHNPYISPLGVVFFTGQGITI